MRIAYQGVPGAFSFLAAQAWQPGAGLVGMVDFESVVRAVRDGAVDAGLVPVENSSIGPIDAAHAALDTSGVVVADLVALRVVLCLVALPGATPDMIRSAESHPAALAQCAGWLAQRGISSRDVVDTAAAAQSIATDRDFTRAAVASAEAAELYGLVVLAEDIADLADNTTRFVVIRRSAAVAAA
ncbi:MAG: prephenate dehydratase [Gemmatimonadales bacterium]|nr:prephenate dehydratase [Gemmatimonadales bacterium]